MNFNSKTISHGIYGYYESCFDIRYSVSPPILHYLGIQNDFMELLKDINQKSRQLSKNLKRALMFDLIATLTLIFIWSFNSILGDYDILIITICVLFIVFLNCGIFIYYGCHVGVHNSRVDLISEFNKRCKISTKICNIFITM